VVLIIRIGALVEALVVVGGATVADPLRATHLLKGQRQVRTRHPPTDIERQSTGRLRWFAPVAAVAAARWRAGDAIGSRAAHSVGARREGRGRRDGATPRSWRGSTGLISRLALGMDGGRGAAARGVAGAPAALAIGDVLAWQERLPPPREPSRRPRELVARSRSGRRTVPAVRRRRAVAPRDRSRAARARITASLMVPCRAGAAAPPSTTSSSRASGGRQSRSSPHRRPRRPFGWPCSRRVRWR